MISIKLLYWMLFINFALVVFCIYTNAKWSEEYRRMNESWYEELKSISKDWTEFFNRVLEESEE